MLHGFCKLTFLVDALASFCFIVTSTVRDSSCLRSCAIKSRQYIHSVTFIVLRATVSSRCFKYTCNAARTLLTEHSFGVTCFAFLFSLQTRHMRNVSFPPRHHSDKDETDKIEFTPDNTLKYIRLDIVNLNNKGYWEKIGLWKEKGLDIKDITWPGSSPVPPPGLPDKFHLKVTYLEEPPFVNVRDPDTETGECNANRAVRCRFAPESVLVGMNKTLAFRDPRYYRCCSGFCIDLLKKFASDLKFTFELNRVEDGTWGALNVSTLQAFFHFFELLFFPLFSSLHLYQVSPDGYILEDIFHFNLLSRRHSRTPFNLPS